MDPTDPNAQQAPDPAAPQIFMAHKQMGLSDLDAALATRSMLQRQAEARGSFRNAQDLFVGLGKQPLTGDALRTQLHGEANQPIEEAGMRAQARYGDALADPSHPVNQTLQGLATKHLGAPPGNKLTVATADALGGPLKSLSDYAKTTAEAQASAATAGATALKAPAEASKLGAETAAIATKTAPEAEKLSAEAEAARAGAGKTTEEAAQIAKNAASERALKGAQAKKTGAEAVTEGEKPAQVKAETEKTGAETGKIKMETGAQVSPGWVRTGETYLQPGELEKFRDKASSVSTINQNIDEIRKIVGDQKILTDTKKRAAAQVRLAQIVKSLAHETGQRGLPAHDIEFFGKMIGDPTNWSPSNIVKTWAGLTDSATKLQTVRDMANQGLDADAKAHGISRVGAGAPMAGGETVRKFTRVNGKLTEVK